MANPKDKAFKKLQEKWYKKLEKDGFKDIEQDENTLKGYSSIFANKHTAEEIKEKLAYNDMATAFLEQYKFETELDKVIWEYHLNGLSHRDITKVLKKVKVKSRKTINRDNVGKIVKRLKVKMFDMLWAPLKEYHEGRDE